MSQVVLQLAQTDVPFRSNNTPNGAYDVGEEHVLIFGML
jgi:hypothetical protein